MEEEIMPASQDTGTIVEEPDRANDQLRNDEQLQKGGQVQSDRRSQGANSEQAELPQSEQRVELDARGLKCPEPVMLLHQALNELADGDLVTMTATDPTTQRDVRKFCQYLQHDLLDSSEEGGIFSYTIRKGSAKI